MPVLSLAPRCHCGRPLIDGLVCRRHELLARVSGGGVVERAVTRFDAMVELGAAVPADSPEFDQQLRSWISP